MKTVLMRSGLGPPAPLARTLAMPASRPRGPDTPSRFPKGSLIPDPSPNPSCDPWDFSIFDALLALPGNPIPLK